MSKEEQTCLYAMQLSNLSALPMTLATAIELGLLKTLVREKTSGGSFLTASEIAKELSITNPDASAMIDRMLCYLASYDIVVCACEMEDGDSNHTRRYAATAVSKYLVESEDGVSLAPSCLFSHGKVRMERWYHMKNAVLEGGIPFERAYGMTMYEHERGDEEHNKMFNTAMATHSTVFNKFLLAEYTGFEELGLIVDVGGGIGATLDLLISKYPNIRGINFDQPHVIANAPSLSGIEHVGGDMFDAVPSGDAIVLKWVIRNWSDEECIKLLKNCWKALPENGKVIVIESIFPAKPDSSLTSKVLFQQDIVMLTVGGKERTLEEFQSMATEAGFSGFKLACSVLITHVMEFTK